MAHAGSDGIEVGIVEGDEKTRQYIGAVIGGTPGMVTGWACSTGKQGLASMGKRCPMVVLVSLFLPDLTGIDFIARARRLKTKTVYLLLVPDDQPGLFVPALEAGACGYLPKVCSADELIRAILTVHQGGVVVSNFLAKPLLDYFRARGSVLNQLTEREQRVLKCLSRGLSPAHLAVDLGIDQMTVRTHVRNILSKLDVHSTAEAIALYLNPTVPRRRTTREVDTVGALSAAKPAKGPVKPNGYEIRRPKPTSIAAPISQAKVFDEGFVI